MSGPKPDCLADAEFTTRPQPKSTNLLKILVLLERLRMKKLANLTITGMSPIASGFPLTVA
jgi:hypothetical protein